VLSTDIDPASATVRAVAEAASAVSGARTLHEVVEVVVDQALQLGAAAAHLALADEQREQLHLVAHRNLGPELAQRMLLLSFDSPLLAARCARARELVAVEDIEQLDPALTMAREVLQVAGSRSLFSLPLLAFERLVGVLTFALKQPHAVTAAERAALLAIGEMFAVAITNAQQETGPRGVDWPTHTRLVQEIAARGQAQASLVDRELRLRAIFDHSFQFIGLLSPEGILLEANRSSLDFAGYGRSDVLGKPFWQARWWADSPAKQARIKDAITRAASGEFVRFEVTHLGPEGREIVVDFSLSPVRDDVGRVVLLVPEGRDITERRQLEQLREEWTNIVAHDLKQPLNAIHLWLRVLSRSRDTIGVKAISALDHIQSSVLQLSRLTDDLLDVSRIEAGRLQLHRRTTDLLPLVAEVADRFSSEEEGRAVQFHWRGDAYKLEVDPGRIEQVISNLLSNAIKYGQAATAIELELEFGGDQAELCVKNQGAAIPPEELARVFDRFYRAREAEAADVPGSGLGLFIAQRLVEAHGGRIWVESTRECTAFRLALPRLRDSDGTTRPSGE
jgi:PAS domain S-box-containing protein